MRSLALSMVNWGGWGIFTVIRRKPGSIAPTTRCGKVDPGFRQDDAWVASGLPVLRQVVDGRLGAAERAGGVARDADLAELGAERVIDQQAAGQAVADAQHLLQHLGRLQRAGGAGPHAPGAR